MKIFLKLTCLLGVGLLLSFSNANAYSVTSLLSSGGLSTTLSDNSAEVHFDLDSSGSINTGDVLLTVIALDSINSTAVGFGTAYEEVTAILGIEVATGPLDTEVNSQNITLGDYTATTISAGAYAAVNGILTSQGLSLDDYLGPDYLDGDNTVGNVFVDAVINDGTNAIPEETTIGDLLYNYTDGDNVLELALDTTNGDYIDVTAPVSLSDPNLTILANGWPIASSSLFVDLTISEQNWTNVIFGEDFAGNGTFQVAASGAAGIRDDGSYFVTTTIVPEPGTMILFGLGLLSVAGVARRRE